MGSTTGGIERWTWDEFIPSGENGGSLIEGGASARTIATRRAAPQDPEGAFDTRCQDRRSMVGMLLSGRRRATGAQSRSGIEGHGAGTSGVDHDPEGGMGEAERREAGGRVPDDPDRYNIEDIRTMKAAKRDETPHLPLEYHEKAAELHLPGACCLSPPHPKKVSRSAPSIFSKVTALRILRPY
jgi:hypothetical protein